MSHYEERLEADLLHIRDWVWSMGEDVEQALRDAKKVLFIHDQRLAYATVLRDHPINRESRECDRLCHVFIARHLPSAGHLREMASTIRVNVALERIGDYAVTICREAMQLDGPVPEQFAGDIDTLADEALDILTQSREAFRDNNAEQAIAAMQAVKRIRARMDGIYEALFAADERMDGRTMMAVFVILNLFKRTADQAKNICDQTVYSVRGVRKLPKVHRVLFLDRPGAGLGQLAVAIGHKLYPETGLFKCATPGRSDLVSGHLKDFLDSTGLPADDLETEPLEAIRHDIADFDLVISLQGHFGDHIGRLPFHTSGLDWDLGEVVGADLAAHYRYLRQMLTELVTMLAGEHAS